MPEALALVKRTLGPDAVILGTRSGSSGGLGRMVGRRVVEITAAPPETPAPAPRAAPGAGGARAVTAPRTTPSALAQNLLPYYVQLVQNEVAGELAVRLLQSAAAAAGGNATEEALRATIRRFIAQSIPTSGGITLTEDRRRGVALLGPAGGGKTTTLAKLAAHFKLRKRLAVAILSLDTHRLAANEQLQRYAEIIGVPMRAAQTVQGVQEALAALGAVQLVLIDTPGLSLRDRGRFARLAALLRATRPDEVHLVLPACLAEAVQMRAAQTFAPLGVTRVVFTRLDDAVGLGVILNAMQRLHWQLSYLTDGQRVPKDIEEACSERVAELVLSAGG